MRTTLEISPDAYQIAKTVSRETSKSLGWVVSEFIVGHLGAQPVSASPSEEIFPTFRCVRRVTSEDVVALNSDDDTSAKPNDL